jgi:hypothetical protein
MKKLFLLFVTIYLISNSVSAQLEKGGWITSLQGNYSLKGPYYGSYRTQSLLINPGVMKLVHHNLAVGMVFNFGYEKTKDYPIDNGLTFTWKSYSLEAGPVLRKYFGDYKLKPYAELSSGIKYDFNKSTFSDNSKFESHDTNLFIRPLIGFSYWINDRISIDISAGTDLMEDNLKELNVNLGFSVKLGK